jgi:PTH1 family peptidyl-tRNA hydrolase
MKLIIGLGNLGDNYKNTRHNGGFMVVDEFAKIHGFDPFLEKPKFKALLSKKNVQNTEVVLAKPLTYMNNSGEAVQILVNFYKLDISKDILIIYDDIDLELGMVRFRNEGSSGTHNGMRSVISILGTDKFFRLRIGIESRGSFASKEQDLHSFVLDNFNNDEKKIFEKVSAGSITEINNFICEQNPLAFSRSFI